jgi:hypothetical protein
MNPVQGISGRLEVYADRGDFWRTRKVAIEEVENYLRGAPPLDSTASASFSHGRRNAGGMKLYHVTSPSDAKRILKNGLTPRTSAMPDYDTDLPSNPDMVYLTSEPDSILSWWVGPRVVLEIEIPNASRLYPDEDYLAHGGLKYLDPEDRKVARNWLGGWGGPQDTETFEAMWDLMVKHKSLWKQSLKGWKAHPRDPLQKTVAYRGSIGPQFIMPVR